MKHDDIIPYYIGQLRSKNNVTVNRAGMAPSYMKDPTSIRPLIDALITVHEYKVTTGNPNGGMSSTFGTGPGGRMGPGMGGPGLSRRFHHILQGAEGELRSPRRPGRLDQAELRLRGGRLAGLV